MDRGYRQIEHTADVALELWGPSEEDVLAQGARAVTELLTDDAEHDSAATASREVALTAVDRADRLVQWLNAIIVAAVTDGFVFSAAELALDGDTGLRARVRGQAHAHHRVRSELKSATYHDLVLERRADGSWRARVVIDV